MAEGEYTNRLIREKSPYLLQHAHNPVDWYPWGDEAFQSAKSMDKPIFLSIGYSTCHWCHVMEKESFSDPNIANLLNEAFVNIKIDREELPEIDSLYMEFAQGMMAGAAGWPLNVILTPDLQPFFAATYLPPYSRHGLIGLTDLIARIREVWHGEERETVVMQAEQVVEVFSQTVETKGEELPQKEQLQDISDLLFRMADPVYGGMKGTPKFPIGYQYNFMLRYGAKQNESRSLFLVEKTLDMMHRGGIYDHIGGGFSRYSIDEKWTIPHFEKMLYDNAFLAYSYLETWQITKNPLYREVCEETLQYVLREMTHPEGGFYSAQDADSEGHEGLFYTWTVEEITQLLGKEDADLFCGFYGVTEEGNFEGRNVLNMPQSFKDYASKHGLNTQDLILHLATLRQKLFRVREKRIHPLKDDKILSSWNGLMIFSLVEAGRAFNEEKYVQAALKAARFIKTRMWRDGQLYRRWRDGETMFNAGLDEYAFLARGLISLFEADCGTEWLAWAIEIADVLEERFKDEGGAFYQTDGSDTNLLMRKCQFSDGAEPSGNAIHCENLLRLYQLTAEEKYLEQAVDILKAAKKYMDSYSPGYCYHMMNLNRFYDKKSPTFVIALNGKEDHLEPLRHLIYSEFIPHKAVVWKREKDNAIVKLCPFIENQGPIEKKTTMYVCYQGVCQKPLTDYSAMAEAIRKSDGF